MARAALFTFKRKGRARVLPHHYARVYISGGASGLAGTVSDTLVTQDSADASVLALTAPALDWPVPRRAPRSTIASDGWIWLFRPGLATTGPGSVVDALSLLDSSNAQINYAPIGVVDIAPVSDFTDAIGGSGPPPIQLGGRALTQAVAAALVARVVRPAIFYEGEFAGGTLRLWSGLAPFPWNGHNWAGAGSMLGISAVGETSEVRAVAFEVSLTGALSELVSLSLSQGRQGLPGRVWLGFFDDAGNLIADPFKCFDGRMDVMDISDDAVTARIAARYESRLIDLDRTRERRYTSEDQKLDFPGDLGFEYVPALQNQPLYWGRVSPEVKAQRYQELLDAQAAWDASQAQAGG